MQIGEHPKEQILWRTSQTFEEVKYHREKQETPKKIIEILVNDQAIRNFQSRN